MQLQFNRGAEFSSAERRRVMPETHEPDADNADVGKAFQFLFYVKHVLHTPQNVFFKLYKQLMGVELYEK